MAPSYRDGSPKKTTVRRALLAPSQISVLGGMQEEEATLSNTLLRSVTDSLTALVAFVDMDLRYRFVNAVYAQFFKMPIEDILHSRIEDVLGPENFRKVRGPITRAMGGEQFSYEAELELAGRLRKTVITYVPQLGPDAKSVIGVNVLAVDVTEHKVYEAELEEHARQLEELDRRKDEFLALLGHELRNPIGAISNAAELLRRGSVQGEQRDWPFRWLVNRFRSSTV